MLKLSKYSLSKSNIPFEIFSFAVAYKLWATINLYILNLKYLVYIASKRFNFSMKTFVSITYLVNQSTLNQIWLKQVYVLEIQKCKPIIHRNEHAYFSEEIDFLEWMRTQCTKRPNHVCLDLNNLSNYITMLLLVFFVFYVQISPLPKHSKITPSLHLVPRFFSTLRFSSLFIRWTYLHDISQ